MKTHRPLLSLVVLAGLGLGSCGGAGNSTGRPQLAFVTNGVASFWVIAAAGVEAAARDFDVDCEVHMPIDSAAGQKSIVENLLAAGVDGIAISPIDDAGQADLLAEAYQRTALITHDSDGPEESRLCYVGMDNYEAGRAVGGLVKEALPEGGSVMLFIGRLEQANGRDRRQGVIDELLDRERQPGRFDPPNARLEGERYVILDTRTDQIERARAKANAEDALALYPDLDCMVGLFAENPPACLEALSEAEKLGQVQVVGFDEHEDTLQGILDGHVYGTVVQQPYEYGYQSVRILAAYLRGEEDAIPEGGYLEVPAQVVTRENAREFWDQLNALLEGGG